MVSPAVYNALTENGVPPEVASLITTGIVTGGGAIAGGAQGAAGAFNENVNNFANARILLEAFGTRLGRAVQSGSEALSASGQRLLTWCAGNPTCNASMTAVVPAALVTAAINNSPPIDNSLVNQIPTGSGGSNSVAAPAPAGPSGTTSPMPVAPKPTDNNTGNTNPTSNLGPNNTGNTNPAPNYGNNTGGNQITEPQQPGAVGGGYAGGGVAPVSPVVMSGVVPSKANEVIDYVSNNGGNPPPGFVGGRSFENDGRNGGQVLPQTDANGNQIAYQEYDVNPKQPGVNRGAERVVIGSDGSAYYTNDHYSTFTRVPKK